MNTDADIVHAFETGFPGFQCYAKIWDYGDRLRFQIRAKDGRKLLTVPEALTKTLRADWQLTMMLNFLRRTVQERAAAR